MIQYTVHVSRIWCQISTRSATTKAKVMYTLSVLKPDSIIRNEIILRMKIFWPMYAVNNMRFTSIPEKEVEGLKAYLG